MQITEVSFIGVRTAIVPLRRRDTPMRFTLFPMIHFGRPEFYAEVADRLRRSALIVAEGADQPTSTGLAYVLAMRATRQRGAARLVRQHIDYAALGAPVIWPDLEPGERPRSLASRAWGWVDVVVMTPVLTVMMAVGGPAWLLRQRYEVSDDTEVRIRLMTKMFVDERDEKLLDALVKIHEERKGEAIDVAVVYGAGHMPAVVRGLYARFGYRPVRGSDWLTVIDT